MSAISSLTACPKRAVVRIEIPETLTPIRKRPGVAHFVFSKKGDMLPVYLHLPEVNMSLKKLRKRILTCYAWEEEVTLRRGLVTNVLGLEPVDADEVPNAQIVRIRRQEFRVQTL